MPFSCVLMPLTSINYADIIFLKIFEALPFIRRLKVVIIV
jgi:hypothetical protein